MKTDMAGAAAIVAVMTAVAGLDLPVEVDRHRADGGEPAQRLGVPAGRRADHVRRQDGSRCSTPTPRAG